MVFRITLWGTRNTWPSFNFNEMLLGSIHMLIFWTIFLTLFLPQKKLVLPFKILFTSMNNRTFMMGVVKNDLNSFDQFRIRWMIEVQLKNRELPVDVMVGFIKLNYSYLLMLKHIFKQIANNNLGTELRIIWLIQYFSATMKSVAYWRHFVRRPEPQKIVQIPSWVFENFRVLGKKIGNISEKNKRYTEQIMYWNMFAITLTKVIKKQNQYK